MEATRHLDLGCGNAPRNPYKKALCFGCDIRDSNEINASSNFEYKEVNLVLTPIPFPDNYFDSVSAFDFIEHVPRQLVDHTGKLVNPFVNLMSEIHRVLKPGGMLLAVTPAYPSGEAFQDPTHVNIITIKTHEYFVGDDPYAAAYGFKGRFSAKRVEWGTAKSASQLNTPEWRKKLRNLHRRLFKSGLSHLIWELEVKK